MAHHRIISLVPSLTEFIITIGLKEQLVGRTRFCIHPKDSIEDIPIMGGTKNPRIDKILATDPDFIIANKEENRSSDIRRLQNESDAHIVVTEIATIEEALLTLHRLGQTLDAGEQARQLTDDIHGLLEQRPETDPLRTAYFIWKDPWMSVGGDTYIHDVMLSWELRNVFGHRERYPKLELSELSMRNPELILLSSEPYPFKQKHVKIVKEACPQARVLPVDGEWFSWYGARMKPAFRQLNTWRKTIAEK